MTDEIMDTHLPDALLPAGFLKLRPGGE